MDVNQMGERAPSRMFFSVREPRYYVWRGHEPYKRDGDRAGKLRNKPCPCGSGRKFKKCCW